jgi:hypothetical protein
MIEAWYRFRYRRKRESRGSLRYQLIKLSREHWRIVLREIHLYRWYDDVAGEDLIAIGPIAKED